MDKKDSCSYSWVYGIALLLSLGLLGGGIYLAVTTKSWPLLGAGAACLIAVLISWPLSAHLHQFHCSSSNRAEQALTSINERFEQFSVMLNLISEQQLLSDRAKAVAFREKDSDALRRAIQEEMLKQNWESASVLANEMEKSFGYKKEADALRSQIDERHYGIVRKQITDAIAVIDRHIRGENWTEARAESQRVAAQFPDDINAIALPQEVEKRHQAHKQALIDSWNEAVARHDVDGAIEILKRLDFYLTPTEAESFQDTARNVFKEKINTLRTQFAVAYKDERWNEAIRLAEVISRDFPNSQLAKEVRDLMDTMRARAGGITPAAV